MNRPSVSFALPPAEDLNSNRPVLIALKFLQADNRYRAIFSKNRTGEYTFIRESVDAAVIVAAFIAGVQAQVIAFTYNQNIAKVQIAANIFGFVGVVFDILGASIGVIHAVRLKKTISENQELDREFMDNEKLKEVQMSLRNTLGGEKKAYLVQSLVQEMYKRKGFWIHRYTSPYIPWDPEFREHLTLLFPLIPEQSWIKTIGASGNLGWSAITSIRLGVLFLLVSVLIFAGYSQPRVVWITCLAVTLLFGVSFILEIAVADTRHAHEIEGSVLRDLQHVWEALGTNLKAASPKAFAPSVLRVPVHHN